MKRSITTFLTAFLTAVLSFGALSFAVSAAEADGDISAENVSAYPDTDPALVIAGKRIGNSRGYEISIPDPKDPVVIYDEDGDWAEGLETKDMSKVYEGWYEVELPPKKRSRPKCSRSI